MGLETKMVNQEIRTCRVGLGSSMVSGADPGQESGEGFPWGWIKEKLMPETPGFRVAPVLMSTVEGQ